VRPAAAPRPVGSFDPAGYPGPRPDAPVLVHDGHVHDVEVVGDAVASLRSSVDAPVLAPEATRWVVAYGSNASPARLVSKRLDRRGAVLLPARLRGWVTAFEHRRTRYGAVPLTLVPRRGAETETWVLGVHVDDVDALDVSEGRLVADARARTTTTELPAVDDGLRRAVVGAYRLGRIGEVEVHGRWRLADAVAYLPGVRTRVQVAPSGRWRTWPEHDHRAAVAHLADAGEAAAAPVARRVVRGPWPADRLRPAPGRA
jgi:hypothetical protein